MNRQRQWQLARRALGLCERCGLRPCWMYQTLAGVVKQSPHCQECAENRRKQRHKKLGCQLAYTPKHGAVAS